jgi:serine/threonine protein kinase
VAVKILPAAFGHDPERQRRFEQEARATGMLNHPNILAVYDVGTHEGAPYLVTELLQGETLCAALPLSRRKALECAQQTASGLAAAHAKGITHRDLKPENLFLTRRLPPEDPRLRLGEALQPGRTGVRRDRRGGHRVILYEMLSGPRAISRSAASGDLKPSEIPSGEYNGIGRM